MNDNRGAIPDGHIRISFQMGLALYQSQHPIDHIEKRITALENDFIQSARLGRQRMTPDGYLSARLVAIEAMKIPLPQVVCDAILWMFLYRTNAAQSRESHGSLQQALDRYGSVWLCCETDAAFTQWSFGLQDSRVPADATVQ